MKMNILTRAVLVAASVALISPSAHAQFTQNDLYLGFTSASANSDLVFDIGGASSLFGASSTVNLSAQLGSLASFNSVFNNSSSGVFMSVIGGSTAVSGKDIIASQIRIGGAGNAGLAGSDLTGASHNATAIGAAAQVAGITGLPASGNSATLGAKGYSAAIATGVQNNFTGITGINPAGAISTGLIYEDIWIGTQSGGYAYKGYLTFDYNSAALSFTPAAVPEPATCSLFAAAAILALCARRAKTA